MVDAINGNPAPFAILIMTLLAERDSQETGIWINYAVFDWFPGWKPHSGRRPIPGGPAGEETCLFWPNSPDSRRTTCRVQREVSGILRL
jgi:hypothetical protein